MRVGEDLIAQRLEAISREIALLQEQQAVLLELAGQRKATKRAMDKQAWTALLRAAGMDEQKMARWHALFEQQSPEAHADFLRSLGRWCAE